MRELLQLFVANKKFISISETVNGFYLDFSRNFFRSNLERFFAHQPKHPVFFYFNLTVNFDHSRTTGRTMRKIYNVVSWPQRDFPFTLGHSEKYPFQTVVFTNDISWMWKCLAVKFIGQGSIYPVKFSVSLFCHQLRKLEFGANGSRGQIGGLTWWQSK